MWICVIYVNSDYIIIFVIQNKKNRAEILLIPALPPAKKRQSAKSPLPPAKKCSRQRAFATCQKKQSAKSPLPPAKKSSRQRALCHSQKMQSAKSPLPPAKKSSRQRNSIIKKNKKSLRQRGCAPSSHDDVRFLCRLPYWQVAKALPTAFLLAGGKGFFADGFFATCSLSTATCKTVGKAFATCFRAFGDCFWQSATNRIPVVSPD